MNDVKVFVIDSEGQPCLPTKPRRARQLLDQGRAKVKQVVPFTIQLVRKVENPVGSFEVGIDDGAVHVGIAFKNIKTEEIVFRGEIQQRQNVSFLMEHRRNYRATRRQRLRCRPQRINNRIKSKLAPSARQKKEAILRVVKDMSKRLKVVKSKVEEVAFDHYTKDWGKWFSRVEVGKTYLKEQLKKLGLEYEKTNGIVTKKTREKLGLSKRHSHDASAILESNKLYCREYLIKPRRTKQYKDRKFEEKNGFRHYDLIKANLAKKTVVGFIISLKTKGITIGTKRNKNYLNVVYHKSKLLQRFRGIIYYWKE